MKQVTDGPFKQTFSLNHHTGRFLKEDIPPIPLFDATRRFSIIFVSASARDAANLNRHLSAAGIRAYHAADAREVELLLAITRAKALLIDIDCTLEPGLAVLQAIDASHPGLPKVVLTARDANMWSSILPHFALDIVPKPFHLGELLGALEHAHLVERELNDPEQARRREMRIIAAIRTASQAQTLKHIQPNGEKANATFARSIRRSIRARLSAMMDRVTYVWWKFGWHRTRK